MKNEHDFSPAENALVSMHLFFFKEAENGFANDFIETELSVFLNSIARNPYTPVDLEAQIYREIEEGYYFEYHSLESIKEKLAYAISYISHFIGPEDEELLLAYFMKYFKHYRT